MNRILLLPIIVVAGCISLANGAKAQTDSSASTGTLPATCSITAAPAILLPTTNIIIGGNFPTELTSVGGTGKFTTLCSAASNQIKVKVISVSSPPEQGGSPYVTTYSLSASGSSAYVGNAILSGGFGSIEKTGTISHGFSNTASELLVAGKITSASGKILGDGEYEIKIRATLTP